MRRTFFAALVAVGMVSLFTSCEDSSFIGFDPEEMDYYLNEDDNSVKTSNNDNQTESDKILPDSWGRVVGVGVSAIPADDEGGSYAKKCMVIRCEHGAVAISFNMEEIVPDEGAITSAYFVEGNFSAEYNGGIYVSGKWEPAISKDMSDRIAYFVEDTCMRNIRNTTLARWDWRDGNWSTVIDGYSFDVDGDTLLIFYNGELHTRLR